MSHHNSFLQSLSDPMSPYNMSLQYFREEQKRISKRESDRINERYYKSMASSNNIFSPSTPTSLDLEKRCAERWEQYDRRFNTSSSSNLMKAIKSLFSWR